MLTISWKKYSILLGWIFNGWPLLRSKILLFWREMYWSSFWEKAESKLFYYQVTFGFFCVQFHPNEICKLKIRGLPNSHPGLKSRSIDFGHVQWTISTVLRVMRVQVTTNKYWRDCENTGCGQILLLTVQLYLSGDTGVAFAYFHNPGFGGLSGLDFI